MAEGILADEAMTEGAAAAAGEELPEFSHEEFSRHAEALAAMAERALASGAARQIASEDIARVLTAAVKLYAARAEAEEAPPPPVSAERVTPTEIVVVVSEMMRAANLNLFDLSMWYRRAR
jgi:hypothetical protein